MPRVRVAPLVVASSAVALLLSSCPTTEPPPPVGPSLFAEGCPVPGQALARVIGVDATLPGAAATGTKGDLLLANDRAAFVVTDTGPQSTYWYYPGVLADATTVADCVPAPDKLDELGYVFVVADVFEFEQSILRAFEAETVEVVNDGSDGGAAVVRARGSDSIHWLVEHTLIKEAADSGGRDFSEPYGVEITIDYVLEPDSSVLFMDVGVLNLSSGQVQLVDAALMQHGHTMDEFSYSSGPISVASLNLDAGLPWILASDGAGAYALNMSDANLATVTFSGVQTGVDVNQLNDGFTLGIGERKTLRRYLAVGPGDGTAAIEALLTANPVPLRDQPATAARIRGSLQEADGSPAAGTVLVQARAGDASWGNLYRAVAGEDGAFTVAVPELDEPWSYRLLAEGPGRDAAAPVSVDPGDSGVTLTLEPRGNVAYAITADGEPSPARLAFLRDDGKRFDFWEHGEGRLDLPPGTWEWTATRGYEFTPDRGTVTVPAGGEAAVEASLARAFETDGWISVDTHVHTMDSPDSRTDVGDQMKGAAAHGLDVVIHTEHEHIVDRRYVPAEVGVDGWSTSVIGEEVTSVAVEHMTMFPVEPDGSPRGGYVEWYGMDMEELFAAMRARSDGGVNLLNHPGWMNDIGWDRVAAEPTVDPTLLGFTEDDALWSWDLDGVEVMNGHSSPFADGNGRFDDWMSMVNAGHRVIGVGCSDAHGREVGFPRTYVTAPSDDVTELDTDALTDSFQSGRAMASAGAYAQVTIDGAGPGELVADDDGAVTVSIAVEALAEVNVTHAVVFVNCDQAASIAATDPDAVLKLDATVTVPVDGDSSVVVAAFGEGGMPFGLRQYDATRTPRVLVNPIYVDFDGDGAFSAPGGRECSYDLAAP